MSKNKTESESILGAFDSVDMEALGQGFDFQAIAALLSLPEEEFLLMEEFILNEMEMSMNSTQERLAMTHALNATGTTPEELVEQYELMTKTMEKEYEGKLSQSKIDFLKRMMGIITKMAGELEGISKRVIPVALELCHPDAKMPEYARPGDAGMDVYAVEDTVIHPGETKIVRTGLKMAIPLGYEIQVRPRSGLSVKTPLRVANSPGTVDANYRGEIGVIVTNTESEIQGVEVGDKGSGEKCVAGVLYGGSYTITKGMRFAQLVLKEVPLAAFYEVQSVSEIGFDRGGGFGSSGGEG